MTNPTVPTTLTPRDKFSDLMKRVDNLYATKIDNTAPVITARLSETFDQVDSSGDQDVAAKFVDSLEEIFEERQSAIEERKKVLKHFVALEKMRNSPSGIGVKTAWEHGFGNSSNPVYLSDPSSKYVLNLMQMEARSKDILDVNSARLKSLIETQKDLSDESKQEYKGHNVREALVKYGSSHAIKGVIDVLDKVGRGTFTKGKAVKSAVVKEYNAKMQNRIEQLRSKMDYNQSNYGKSLQNLISRIKSSEDPIDVASCENMCQMLEKQIAEEQKDYKDRIEQLDKEAKNLAKEMEGKVQSDIDKEDAMMPYRLVSIFLVFTPFAPLSIAGHVFNYLDPLSQILGPIFSAHKTLGQGLGDAITSKEFGPFGWLMDKMEIDKAVEGFFENVPIVNNFSEVFDALTDNDIAQGLISEASPLIDSTLVLLGIGGVYALSRAPEELDLSKSKRETCKKYLGTNEVGLFPSDRFPGFKLSQKSTGALDSLFDAYEKDVEKVWEKKLDNDSKNKYGGVINEEFTILEQADIDKRMCEFLVKLAEVGKISEINKFFNELEPVYKQYDHNLSHKNKSDVNKMLRFLNENKTIQEGVREKFLLIAALDEQVIRGDLPSSEKFSVLADLMQPDKAEKRKTMQEEVVKDFNREFYFGEAQKAGMKVDRSDKELENIKCQLKAQKIAEYQKSWQNHYLPSSRTIPISHEKLGSQQEISAAVLGGG